MSRGVLGTTVGVIFCGVARWARDTISEMRKYVTVCGHRIRVCVLLACSITDKI